MRAIRPLVSCLLVLGLVLVSDHVSALGAGDLESIGPEGGWITALALSPAYSSDGKLWTATFGGRIFASNDAAASWHESHTGESDPVVEALAASPAFATDGTVFAAADAGVFRSVDGGSTWVDTSAGLNHHFSRAIVLSPSYGTDRTVWVATDAGVYRSTDGGSGWVGPVDETRPVISLAAGGDGGSAAMLYAGLDAGGMDRSSDGGVHWQSVEGFPATRRALAILAVTGKDGSTVIAATDNGIWRTTDGGLSWLQVAASGDRVDALAAAGSTGATSALYAGSASGAGVYASTDSGATWSRVGAPDVPFVTTLVAVGPSTVIAGTAGGGISISHDGGVTWNTASHQLLAQQTASLRAVGGEVLMGGNGGAYILDSPQSNWRPFKLPSHFVTSVDGRGSDLFAGTQDSGLQISHDAGASWQQSTLPGSSVSQVGLSPPNGGASTLLVASDYVYRSVDGGVSFLAGTLPGDDVRSFAFSPDFNRDGTVFAGTLNHGIYRSIDGGANWLPTSTGLPPVPITSLLLPPAWALSRVIYAATAGSGLYVSGDGGSTWSRFSPALPDDVVDALAWTSSGELVAGTEHGLFLLDPPGWTHLGNGWDGYVSTLLDTVQDGNEYLYAGTTGQGVWRAVLGTAPPTPTPVAATSTATSVAPTATTTPRAHVHPTSTSTPRPTTTPRSSTLHLRADPFPARAGHPALLSLKGSADAHVQVSLTTHGWRRKFSGILDQHGREAFGFMSPSSQIAVVAQMRIANRTVRATLVIPVRKN